MDQHLRTHYRVKMDEKLSVGSYEAFRFRNVVYTIIPITNLEQEELVELKQMSDYLISRGEKTVASIVPTIKNSLVSKINDQEDFVLLQLPSTPNFREGTIGSDLAQFHEKGRTFPNQVKRSNRIGQWKKLWEQRLDQMEIFCDEKVRQHPSSYFEKLLVESFPYYIGLTENAIQYLVDTELDDQPMPTDSATICHHRFTKNSWLNINRIKLPLDWVFDHPSRDLSEWVRSEFISQYRTDYNEVFTFIRDYERISRLSTFSWRLLYSRLLFPVHYFEAIEGYYLSTSEKEKKQYELILNEHLKRSSQYETFLKEINKLIRETRTNTSRVPQVNWL
jgi:spore coat protein YutH